MSNSRQDRPSRGFPFFIDGDELEAPKRRMEANQLIAIALRHGVLKPEPEGYHLDNGEGKEYEDDEVIDLEVTNKFYSVERNPTPAS